MEFPRGEAAAGREATLRSRKKYMGIGPLHTMERTHWLESSVVRSVFMVDLVSNLLLCVGSFVLVGLVFHDGRLLSWLWKASGLEAQASGSRMYASLFPDKVLHLALSSEANFTCT